MTEKKKLFDEKGKLFGKVNIIDLIVLALVVVIAIVLCVKVLGRNSGLPSEGTSTELEYTVKIYRVSPEVHASAQEEMEAGGDRTTLMSNGEMLPGCYIKSITSSPHMETVVKEDGTMVISEEPGYVDLLCTIHATVANPITQAIGGQEIRIGRGNIVKTKTLELINGVILTCKTVTPAA